MRILGKTLLGAAASMTLQSPLLAEDVNVECSCRISSVNTADWYDYVISTSVPSKDKATPETLAYACYKQREQAQNACMEGKDRDSSLQYYKGKLQD
jgi:hypothetical protein